MKLYPYQQKVKDLIQNGQSVILQAPTGAGKTRAALAPFIEAFFDFEAYQFPRKCIYSVPMKTLANQFYAEYKQLATTYNRKHKEGLNVTIQTGDCSEDPQLEGDLIFTTIDQSLSNFLCIPYALGNGRANINAGAITSAYLVFDEFHLYDPNTTLPTTLQMLKILKGITPFLLMTATFSTTMLSQLATELDAVIIPQDEAEQATFQLIPAQQKTRRYQTAPRALDAKAVLKHHPPKGRSIAICNTVDRASNLFEAIENSEDKANNTVVKLLHSRFYKEDRDQKETWLQQEFGKAKDNYTVDNAILIATQVIEVGLDITCDVLHTELAPANAVLQRAGRCARYEGESGTVYIYPLPLNDANKVQYAPYHQNGQAELCENTWQAFVEQISTTPIVDFAAEQHLLSTVHNPIDILTLQQIDDDRIFRKDLMRQAIANQERGLSRDLIRYINSQTVIVHPDPNSLENPWQYQGFSLFRGSVEGAFSKLTALVDKHEHLAEIDWIMKRLTKMEEKSEEWGGHQIGYQWDTVTEKSALSGALLVAINPQLATYTPEHGLRIGVLSGEDWEVPLRKRNVKRFNGPFTYHQESYQAHIAGLYKAYQHPHWEWHQDSDSGKFSKIRRLALRDEMAYALKHLEKKLSLPPNLLDKAARYMIAGHDVGKLGQKWQQWAHNWQQAVSKPVPHTMLLAHTDYDDSSEHKQLQKKQGSRPNHAAEGAYALVYLTLALFGKQNMALYRAINTAIARHHSATHQGQVGAFKASSYAPQNLQAALDNVNLNDVSLTDIEWTFTATTELGDAMIKPEKTKQLILYFLLARLLRLADQRSQQ